jgi:hypothetical protein
VPLLDWLLLFEKKRRTVASCATEQLFAKLLQVRQTVTPFSVFRDKSEDDTGKMVEVFHILRPEMDRSGLELSIDNSFTKKILEIEREKKHWSLPCCHYGGIHN